MNWSSLNEAGALNAENPRSANGNPGLTDWGVGIENCPFESLRLSKASACELMLDPSGATATPPNAPACPPNKAPSPALERSLVNAGDEKLPVPPLPTPFICRVP